MYSVYENLSRSMEIIDIFFVSQTIYPFFMMLVCRSTISYLYDFIEN